MFSIALPLLLALASSPTEASAANNPEDDIDVDFLHSEMESIVLGTSARTFEMPSASGEYVNTITGNAPFRRARRGILVVAQGAR